MVERRSRVREVFVVVGERCGAMAGVKLRSEVLAGRR